MKNHALVQKLRQRGLSIGKLANLAGVTCAQASLTLNNTAGIGYRTRPKLAALMTEEELALVGWDKAGKQLAAASTEGAPENRTMCHVEQVSRGE